MSLLSVTVKKAHYVVAQAGAQFNSYVTLKLQHVKSTTVTVKGESPCWEQDFLFETNDLNTGLLIEVWSKGMIWDRAMGYHWLPLQGIPYTTNQEGAAKWLSLDAELVMRDGEVVGTKNPTGNSLLVECRFELPFGRCDPPSGWRSLLATSTVAAPKDNRLLDPENIEASDLQKKLEMLNNIMDPEARAEQARRQMQYFGHSGYSEDSDYTSDLNYPVGQHANSSASQFRSAAHQMHTPQRSLETSRENSYERDDGVVHHYLPQPPTHHQQHLSPGTHRQRHMQQRYSPNMDDYGYGSPNVGNNRNYPENSIDPEPLSYNSRPRNKTNYTSQEWGSHESYYSAQQSFDGVDSCNDYITDHPSRRIKAMRRPSLERQTTLYDDYTDISTYTTNQLNEISYVNTSAKTFNQNTDDFYNTSSYPFQEERYGQDEEDRQWDSGGFFPKTTLGTGKKLPTIPTTNKRRSSVINTSNIDNAYEITSYSCAPTPTPGRRKVLPQIPTKRASSRQSSINEDYDGFRTPTEGGHRGKSLPPTPTKTPKVLARLMAQNKPFNSLPPTPGRQLPKPNLNNRASAKARRAGLMKRTSSAEYNEGQEIYDSYYMRPGAMSARDNYNEDYNYAYQSTDNLPAQPDRDEMQTNVTNLDGGLFGKLTQPATSTVSVTTSTTTTKQNYMYNNIPAHNYQQSDYCYNTSEDTTTLGQDLYQNDANTKNSEMYTSNFTYGQRQEPAQQPSLTGTMAPAVAKAATNFYEEQTSKLKLFGNTLGNRLKSSLMMPQPPTATSTTSMTSSVQPQTTSSSLFYQQASQAQNYPQTTSSQLFSETSSSQLFSETSSSQLFPQTTSYSQTTSSQLYLQTTSSQLYSQTTSSQLYSQTTSSQLYPQTSSSQLYSQTMTSQLYPQTTSSHLYQYQTSIDLDLEAHDDELKNSFDTAISSITSSIANQQSYPEYSAPGIDTMTIASTYDAPPTSLVQTTIAQYHRDQTESPNSKQQAIGVNGGQLYAPPTTTTTSEPTSLLNGAHKPNGGFSRGYLQQQETIDASWQPKDAFIYRNKKKPNYDAEEKYMLGGDPDDDEPQTPVNGDYNITKAITASRESPASVIHVDLDEQSLRRGSSQLTVVDPYHAKANDYPSRRASMDPYANVAPSLPPTSMAAVTTVAGGLYDTPAVGYMDEYTGTPPRKPSVADSYQGAGIPRRTSRQSPELERQDTQEIVPPPTARIDEGALGEEKRVSFEEDEEQKPAQQRPQVTAQQRWHWAYNKIIMQLNVSF